jgi:hypothetical protein
LERAVMIQSCYSNTQLSHGMQGRGKPFSRSDKNRRGIH